MGIEVAASDMLGQDVCSFKGVRCRHSGQCVAHDLPSDL
jgi:hypothetical protein